MTAEIAILNREAVAMAADSASTVSDETGKKIFSSANKIFSLSKHHPVGIMIFGNALFMGVPWETIIKVFRKDLGDTKYNTLYEYSQSFIEFLKGNSNLFPVKEQEKFVINCIYGFFHKVRNEILNAIKNKIEAKGSIDEEEIIQETERLINEMLISWEKGSCNIPNPDKFREKIINNNKSRLYSKKG